MGEDREGVQQIWKLWRHCTWVTKIGIRNKKLTDLGDDGLVRYKQPSKHEKYPVGNLGKLGVAMGGIECKKMFEEIG